MGSLGSVAEEIEPAPTANSTMSYSSARYNRVGVGPSAIGPDVIKVLARLARTR